MGLVDDQGVVARQEPVTGDLSQEDAVGHDLDEGVIARAVGEPHLVANEITESRTQFLGHSLRDGPSGDAPRLRVPDHTLDPTAQVKADLRQLRGLARPGLTCDDDHRVVSDRGRDVVATLGDRQVRVGHLWKARPSPLDLLRAEAHDPQPYGRRLTPTDRQRHIPLGN